MKIVFLLQDCKSNPAMFVLFIIIAQTFARPFGSFFVC